MNTSRTAKLDADILRTKSKIAEFQAKLKELEQRRRGVENMEIVDIVRGLKIPLDQLAEFLQNIKTGGVPTSGQVVPKLKTPEIIDDIDETEDNDE